MSWSESGESLCPIARCLAVVGDRWTMLIMRELFFGNNRFDALQAQTAMSPHLLSTRLKRLESDGVIARRAYQQKPPRHEYVLTDKGQDLYPVLMALTGWGRRWGGTAGGNAGDSSGDKSRDNRDEAQALHLIHRQCGHEVSIGLACLACGAPFTQDDIEATFGAAYLAERRQRTEAFHAAGKKPPATPADAAADAPDTAHADTTA